MTDRKIRFWLSTAMLAALSPAGATLAADMPVKARPLAPAYYDWSGVYVGVHAGYGGGMKDWNDLGFDFAARGFLGGGQVGINKQIASLVFGLELDGSWANLDKTQTLSVGGPIIGFQQTASATSKIDSFLTLAGRAGLAADRWFVYAKGGLAFVHEKHSFGLVTTAFPGGVVDSFAVNASEDRWGAMVGFGAEYALESNWSVKAEYNYMNFASRTVRFTGSETLAGIATPFSLDGQIEQAAIHVAKVGVNYRLGGLPVDSAFAPVPAAPGTNWSGAYVGAEGGYGFGHKEWPDFADPTVPDSGKFDVKGWLVGGTVGANAQAGAFVFGVEGEWMWTGIKGSQNSHAGFRRIDSNDRPGKPDRLACDRKRTRGLRGRRPVACVRQSRCRARGRETQSGPGANDPGSRQHHGKPERAGCAHRHRGGRRCRIRARRQLVGQDRIRLHQDDRAERREYRYGIRQHSECCRWND